MPTKNNFDFPYLCGAIHAFIKHLAIDWLSEVLIIDENAQSLVYKALAKPSDVASISCSETDVIASSVRVYTAVTQESLNCRIEA